MKHQTPLSDYLCLDVLNGRAMDPLSMSLCCTYLFLLLTCRILFVNTKVLLAITAKRQIDSFELINIWKTRAELKMHTVICMLPRIGMSETSVKTEFVCHLLKYFHTFNLHAGCKTCGDKSCTSQGNNTQLSPN